MLANKWLQFAMSLVVALIGWAGTVDWSALGASAGAASAIVGILGSVKVVLNFLAPAAGQSVTATGNTIITHTTSSR